MKFYYINSKNERINFYEYPYFIQDCDLLDYKYSYAKEEGNFQNRIVDVKTEIQERTMKIAVLGDKRLPASKQKEQYRNAVNRLFDVINYDVSVSETGRLYTDTGYYIECQILESGKENWQSNPAFMYNSFKLVIPNYAWKRELKKDFYPQPEVIANEGLDFETDFPFDFASTEIGSEIWEIDTEKSSHFKMIIYGPVTDPKVTVNGYPYQVFTKLESSDYLEIDSRNYTITKHMASGSTANLYNSRQFVPSIFEKIPGGKLRIAWNGLFGFELCVYTERSEPKW